MKDLASDDVLATRAGEVPALIETARLLVRKFRAEDGDDLFEFLSLPEIYAFEPGKPIDRATAGEVAAERATTGNFFAVELKETGKMVGHLYFQRLNPTKFLTWELGYIFNPAYHRRGYCSESARALVGYGFSVLGAHRVVANCDPRNEASWRTLERIGLKREGHFRKHAFFRTDADGNPLWHDCLSYGILEEDWKR